MNCDNATHVCYNLIFNVIKGFIMELALLIYLAGVTENVTFVVVAALMSILILYGFYAMFTLSEQNELPKYRRMFVLWVVLLTSIATFTPDKETIYMMAAGYTGQKVVENIGSSEAVGKVQVILNNKLDEIIVEQQKKLSK